MCDAANQMITSGIADFGYQFVSVEDCWMKKPNDPPYRNSNGPVLPNWKSPDMKSLTDYLHGRELRAGLQISPGP